MTNPGYQSITAVFVPGLCPGAFVVGSLCVHRTLKLKVPFLPFLPVAVPHAFLVIFSALSDWASEVLGGRPSLPSCMPVPSSSNVVFLP